MSNKLKYYPKRGDDAVEFEDKIVRIELPNGDEFTFHWDERYEALVINKAYTKGDSAIIIQPHVSNQISIK